MRKTVLVISRQSALRANVARLLHPMGFAVEVASGERRAREIVASEKLHSTIVAADFLDRQGVTLMRELMPGLQRSIVLADSHSEVKRLVAAMPEAQVLRCNPLDGRKLLEMLAETNAGPVRAATTVLNFESLALDLAGRTLVTQDGQEVTLTHAEFELLSALISQRGRALSRDQLRDAVGGRKADAYDRSIDMLVARLRRKIELERGKPRFIVTVPGIGYKFVARVRRSESLPPGQSDARIPDRKSRLAERRQLTILSCQVMGLSSVVVHLDPEDLHSATRAIHQVCGEVVRRRQGTICWALADEMLVCFGYPEAHEDDAQRAIQTALDLVRAVADLKPPFNIELNLRVGVATGLAVVGSLNEVGGMLVGEPLDVALSLRSKARSGRVVVAESTHELAGRFFNYRALPARSTERVRSWEVLENASISDRFAALRRPKSTGFVGRAEELSHLARIWSKVRRGSGQVVLLSGDAGIGKSRLASEMLQRIKRHCPTVIRYFGSPQHVAAPLAPLVRELERLCSFKSDDTTKQRSAKLGRLLHTDDRVGIGLVSELLGLPTNQPVEIAQLSPLRRKELILRTLIHRILAEPGPVFVLVEDAQWLDAASREFLDLLIERMPRLPLLLMLSSRPESTPSWSDHPMVTTLALTRLGPEDSASLIRHVAADQPMAANVVNGILSRADGVPLFVEELTKAVLEAQRSNASDARARSKPLSIPKTLHASLLERLDRQGEARDTAQVAAAIGREFSYELLRAVTFTTDADLTTALDQLVASGLIVQRGTLPLATYSFKHALVRDAAHDMLVRANRQQVHARIVATLEARFPEAVAAEPGLLAYHCQEAGNVTKAVDYLLLASDRALSRAATTDVLVQLKQALELLSALPDNSDRWSLEMRLQVALGRAEIAAHGYAAKGTRDAFNRARELCEILNDQVWSPVAFLGEWVAAWWGGDQHTALDRAERLLDWGKMQEKPAVQAVAHMAAGMSLTVQSAFAEACHHFEQALSINQFVVPGLQPFIASDIDGRIQCLSYLHDCLFVLGSPARATNAANEASKEWPTSLYSLALAQTTFCRMHTIERNPHETVSISSKLRKLTEGQGYPFFGMLCSIYRGWALANSGNPEGGVALCREGVAQLQATGTTCGMPGYLTLLAECYLIASDPTSGLEAVAAAIAIAEHTNCRERLAEAHRIRGKLLLLARSSALEAEACFRKATMIARGQGARMFELRAARDLADLFAAQHRDSEARAILAPIFDSFTDEVDCIDLQEAKCLLDRIDNEQLAEIAAC